MFLQSTNGSLGKVRSTCGCEGKCCWGWKWNLPFWSNNLYNSLFLWGSLSASNTSAWITTDIVKHHSNEAPSPGLLLFFFIHVSQCHFTMNVIWRSIIKIRSDKKNSSVVDCCVVLYVPWAVLCKWWNNKPHTVIYLSCLVVDDFFFYWYGE